MAYTLIGMLGILVSKAESSSSPAHSRKLLQWQEPAEALDRDSGLRAGHGPSRSARAEGEARGCGARCGVLVDNGYDPNADIAYDAQGLLGLAPLVGETFSFFFHSSIDEGGDLPLRRLVSGLVTPRNAAPSRSRRGRQWKRGSPRISEFEDTRSIATSRDI